MNALRKTYPFCENNPVEVVKEMSGYEDRVRVFVDGGCRDLVVGEFSSILASFFCFSSIHSPRKIGLKRLSVTCRAFGVDT
jgi:hypothetical protein